MTASLSPVFRPIFALYFPNTSTWRFDVRGFSKARSAFFRLELLVLAALESSRHNRVCHLVENLNHRQVAELLGYRQTRVTGLQPIRADDISTK